MKNLLALIAILISLSASAQISVMGGMNMLKSFSPEKPFGGFHIGLEIPRDDAVSIYGRYTHNFSNAGVDVFTPQDYAFYIEPKDPMSTQFGEYIGAVPKMNYHIIEGGTRYYLGNGFDYGFAAYGGSNLMIIFNKVTLDYDPYDEVNFQISEPNSFYSEGSIFSLGFGLGGGVKYTMAPYGTFYLDLGLNYLILGQASNDRVYPGMYRQLFFVFNLGYRKDFMW